MDADRQADGGKLAGRVVLITGGASGIGAAVARHAAALDASIIIADIDAGMVQSTAASITGRIKAITLDVGDEPAWCAAVEEVRGDYGRIDALINAAGILQSDSILSFDKAMFDRVLRVNLVGTFLGLKHVAPVIANSGGGSIVNISSVEGLQGSNSMAAYASSKWGVRGLTKVAAFEFGGKGVRVNSVHPGPIDTPMVNPLGKPREEMTRLSMFDRMPIARYGNASEVAAMCTYLISDDASFVTGAEFVIDGGLTAGNKIASGPTTEVAVSAT